MFPFSLSLPRALAPLARVRLAQASEFVEEKGRVCGKNRLLSHASLTAFALSGVACSVPVEDSADTGARTATHAVVKVQRLELQDGSTRGDALAGFVQIPEGTESETVLALAGLSPSLPPRGECAWASFSHEDLSELPSSELLEADEVSLITDQGVHHLAPHAFPSVYDLLRGVVYSSRDQDGSLLPADARFLFEGTHIAGGDMQNLDVREVSSAHQSPDFPQNLSVDGLPFDSINELVARKVADFTWDASDDARDSIVISLSTSSAKSSGTYQCTFDDSEGYGSVPLLTASGELLAQPGSSALVTVHRVRTSTETGIEGISQVQLRFDFGIERTWSFVAEESLASAE